MEKSFQNAVEFADCIYQNGKIYTVDSEFSTVSTLAFRGKRLIAVGSSEELLKFKGPCTKVVDLEGKAVLPGLIEGHCHLYYYGESLLRLPIRDKSKEDILAMVKEAVADLSPGQWLQGGMGWNNEVWQDPSYPTKEELDAVAPDNPVLLPRMDGHLIWVNSLALKAAGYTEDTPNPPGGEIMRNKDGKLLGCVSNSACEPIRVQISPPDEADRRKALLAAQDKMLSFGVTSINEMHTDLQTIKDLKKLYEQKKYHIRFSGAFREGLLPHTGKEDQEYFDQCPEIGLYDDHFNLRAVKILADGSVGAQSAALLQDYTDRPGWRGTLMQTDEELYRMVKTAALKGMQVITHAIGDAGIDQILTAYERVLKEYPNPDHRFRIEHFQLVTGDSRERAKTLGVIASMQPLHGPNSASMALRRLGPERAHRAYAVGMVHGVLGKFAGGSDAPVASPNPFTGIHAAVTRTNNELEPKGGFCPENAVFVKDAIRAYTIWNAYAQFTDNDRGSLEVGKLADFVVLDRDPLEILPDDLLNVKALETVIGGQTVYQAK